MQYQKKPCPTCHGTGQISYFKGVSRFLISWEECPECNGLGSIFTTAGGTGPEEKTSAPGSTAKKRKKKRKNST